MSRTFQNLLKMLIKCDFKEKYQLFFSQGVGSFVAFGGLHVSWWTKRGRARAGGGLPANLDDCGWEGEWVKFLTAFCECHEGAPPLIVSFTLKKVLQLFEILFMELLPYNVWWVETKIILLASIWLLHYTSNFFFLRGSFEFTSLSLQLLFLPKFFRNGLADFNYFLL